MLILALLCFVVPALPWPKKDVLDLVMWLGFGLTLAFAGAWQLDKASKEALEAQQQIDELTKDEEPSEERSTLRVVR